MDKSRQGGDKRAMPENADDVLFYRNTTLATIEAKAWDKPYTEGMGQARRYATKLAVRFACAAPQPGRAVVVAERMLLTATFSKNVMRTGAPAGDKRTDGCGMRVTNTGE